MSCLRRLICSWKEHRAHCNGWSQAAKTEDANATQLDKQGLVSIIHRGWQGSEAIINLKSLSRKEPPNKHANSIQDEVEESQDPKPDPTV